MQQPALSAFFSYSRADSEFAQRLARSLRAAGANIWLDQLDIEPGKRWDRAVEDALASCPSLLVILTPSSVDSTNVMDEVSFALEEGKTVIPVLYRDCKIPFRLRRVQYVDFRADYDDGVQQLLKVLPEHGVPTQTRESTTQPEHEIEQAHAVTLPPQRSATPEVPTGPSGRGHSAAPLPLAPPAMSVTRDPGTSAPGTPRRHSTSRLLVTGAVGLLVLLAIGTFVALTFKREGKRDSSAEKRSEVEPRSSVDQLAGTKAVPPTASDDSRRLAGSAISPEKTLKEASKTAANQPAAIGAIAPQPNYSIRVFNCDDGGRAFVNGILVAEVGFGNDSGWVDVSRFVRHGTNHIKFQVINEVGAITYGFQVRRGAIIKFDSTCGAHHQYGCEGNRDFPVGVAREFLFDFSEP